MAEGYSDTVILECNRASSIEVRTKNDQNNVTLVLHI